MANSLKILSADVPQADSLASVRRIVQEVFDGANSVLELERQTGYSPRHVRYRLKTAKILGLLTDEFRVTSAGKKLLGTKEGTPFEASLLRRVIEGTVVVRTMIPTLFSEKSVDRKALSQILSDSSGMSIATAERRVQVLCSWAVQLSSKKVG